jgi:excisionase family DNA binding protein
MADPLSPPAPTIAPLLVSQRDAARMLAVSERTIYSLRVRGELHAVRTGASGVRYSIDELRAFVDRQGVAR